MAKIVRHKFVKNDVSMVGKVDDKIAKFSTIKVAMSAKAESEHDGKISVRKTDKIEVGKVG